MTRRFLLDCALLSTGWRRDVLVHVADDGTIVGLNSVQDQPERGARTTDTPMTSPAADGAAERVHGVTVPGMANAHSHAFQRAMAGSAEFARSALDSFWTWRRLMYALANKIEPEDLEAIATQLFIEMLKAGYTTVAEFHYLHRKIGGSPYPDGNELWEAIVRAARTAGIGLTLLPTLYQTSDFGALPLKTEQARFALATEAFLRGIETRIRSERGLGSTSIRTGAAFHSLRAVPPDVLAEATAALRQIDPGLPIHIHIAEQIREVEVCLQQTGQRPIEWLMNSGLPTDCWCLVHATHATSAELQSIAKAGAAVCVSISTEANLGDGFFDAADFLHRGGRICVGSDSQSTVAPAEELRWMEYQQRLRKQRRGVLVSQTETHVGTRLWREAALTGARAIGQPAGALEVGRRADWLVLDQNHPSLAGAADAGALDHLVFAGAVAAIRDIMVSGRWVVRDHHHTGESAAARQFLSVMRRLTST